jgi:hypothetical protein
MTILIRSVTSLREQLLSKSEKTLVILATTNYAFILKSKVYLLFRYVFMMIYDYISHFDLSSLISMARMQSAQRKKEREGT